MKPHTPVPNRHGHNTQRSYQTISIQPLTNNLRLNPNRGCSVCVHTCLCHTEKDGTGEGRCFPVMWKRLWRIGLREMIGLEGDGGGVAKLLCQLYMTCIHRERERESWMLAFTCVVVGGCLTVCQLLAVNCTTTWKTPFKLTLKGVKDVFLIKCGLNSCVFRQPLPL